MDKASAVLSKLREAGEELWKHTGDLGKNVTDIFQGNYKKTFLDKFNPMKQSGSTLAKNTLKGLAIPGAAVATTALGIDKLTD